MLSGPELDAVLEHERAHLDGRHHWVLTPLRALAHAFPGIPILAHASREVGRLLEMCADDVAARRHGGTAVAGALPSLSSAPTPREIFAAASSVAEQRISRLCRPRRAQGTSGGLRRLSRSSSPAHWSRSPFRSSSPGALRASSVG